MVTTVNGSGGFFGGQGDDTLIFDNAVDGEIHGNKGDDFISIEFNGQLITGGTGEDTLLADIGSNTIYGNQGDDSIDAGNGDDVIFGGQGNDMIRLDNRDGVDIVSGNLGADHITAIVSNSAANSIVSSGDLTITDLTTEDTLLITGTSAVLTVNAITSVLDTNGDVLLKYGGGTITLEGVGDGAIDDTQDLLDRDYHILFDGGNVL